VFADVEDIGTFAKEDHVLVARLLLQADEGRVEIQDRRQRL
jgi:hypothetical protein